MICRNTSQLPSMLTFSWKQLYFCISLHHFFVLLLIILSLILCIEMKKINYASLLIIAATLYTSPSLHLFLYICPFFPFSHSYINTEPLQRKSSQVNQSIMPSIIKPIRHATTLLLLSLLTASPSFTHGANTNLRGLEVVSDADVVSHAL